MRKRRVGITPRLSAALDMLKGCDTVADIGCDHGKLSAALLQRGCCRNVIAADISNASLNKARTLIGRIDLEDRVSFREGDGLRVIKTGECDAIAMLGMGGTLMCDILEACETPLQGADAAVFQPMRAQCDIRTYLYRNRYHITDDRVICEQGRYYQIFRAVPKEDYQEWPDRFPNDFFDVGFVSFLQGDKNLPLLCMQQLSQHKKQFLTAKGSEGEAKLASKINALEQILRFV